MTHCIRGTGHSAEVFQQPPSQPYQTAGRHNLGDVIESSLPADVLCLFLLIQLGHVHAVRCHIVRSAAESDNRQQKMERAKKNGRFSAKATSANPAPVTNCVSTTKNFFVLNISRKGLQRNFNVQGSIISEVHKAIWASPTPSPLNISTETMFSTTKGSPMAK